MSSKSLAFLLDSPLQSWGTSSRFDHRGSDPYPSKSGVVGIIAAAMGIDKYGVDEEAKLRPLSGLHFSVFRVSRSIGGRTPQVLLLRDYHTIGGGYDDENHWGRMSISSKAEDRRPFGTVTTYRNYLTDAVFAVVLRGEVKVLETIASALEDPVWGIWFGRKCCIPAVPVFAVIADDQDQSLANLLAKTNELYPVPEDGNENDLIVYRDPVLLCRDLETGEPVGPLDGADTCADTPISYGKRGHGARTVRRF
jgi:CRISPR system Cascade subunit CasD